MSEDAPKKIKRLTSQDKTRGPIRVLYVEDAAVIRDTIARLLELKGYEVAYAKNGKEGVELAQSWKPDVVLMDLRMPVMDGYLATQQIKSGDTVIKYGHDIGRAVADIKVGEHCHVHNLKTKRW